MDANVPGGRSAQSIYANENNGNGGNADTGFNVPILNRPLQYQDYQMLERLVVESIDVYNKWQKKPTSTKEKP